MAVSFTRDCAVSSSALTAQDSLSSANLTEYVGETPGGPEVVAFHIQQTREFNQQEEVSWFLEIENIDLQRRQLTFSYSIIITDTFGNRLMDDGMVTDLAPDELVDLGMFANHPMYINNISELDITIALL